MIAEDWAIVIPRWLTLSDEKREEENCFKIARIAFREYWEVDQAISVL